MRRLLSRMLSGSAPAISHRLATGAGVLSSVLVILIFMSSCSGKKTRIAIGVSGFNGSSGNLRLVGEYPIDVPEPSGLGISPDGKSLWTVSDESRRVYHMDLQGRMLGQFETESKDLEGIAVIHEDSVAIIAERSRKLVIYDSGGKLVRSFGINFAGSDNAGPEGLAYDSQQKEFLVLKESPGILVTVDMQGRELERTELKMAEDYSDLFFEQTRRQFWVLSDVSKSIHVLDHSLKLLAAFAVNIDDLEGLAVHPETGRIYLVSDSQSRLYVLEYDPF